MTVGLNYLEDGDILYGTNLMENLSYDLVTRLNFALDGETTTNQDNFDVDLFTSDTATTKTNLTYDAGTDRYDCDSGQDTCTLITDVHTITANENSVIVKGDITKESTTVVATSVSFNNGSNWTVVTEKELSTIVNTGTQMLVKWVFDRSLGNTGTDYITGYASYYG